MCKPDWDPASPEVMADPRRAFDTMRNRCPVARGPDGRRTIFRNADARLVLEDHETFSNAVSAHLNVPDGMDPPEHTRYRAVIEPYFSHERMQEFEPACREIARSLADRLVKQRDCEIMKHAAYEFAARCQCSFLGWPESAWERLAGWNEENRRAVRSGDRDAMKRLAAAFTRVIGEILADRRGDPNPGDDATGRLMRERVEGRLLTDDEIVSILRNWTAGEVGTISASLGIVLHFLAAHTDVQNQLRRDPPRIDAAVDEMLRLHCPLLSNRRRVTRTARVGDRDVDAEETLVVNWVATNRDPEAFERADEYRPDRDQSRNLVYGTGIHVCPGAPLARLELRLFTEELLRHTHSITFIPDRDALPAVAPDSGYESVPVRLTGQPDP